MLNGLKIGTNQSNEWHPILLSSWTQVLNLVVLTAGQDDTGCPTLLPIHPTSLCRRMGWEGEKERAQENHGQGGREGAQENRPMLLPAQAA